jgi:ABC-type nitrate/sulfonate/bicarbonate transport system substrate-binding protein
MPITQIIATALRSTWPTFLAIGACLALFPIQLDAADRVRVGLAALTLADSAIWIADDRGFFKKYEIDPEVVLVGGGATRPVSALFAGDLQFAATGGGAAISAALGGSDIVIIASGNNKGVQRLVVRPDIKAPEGINGKKIGVTTYGSSGHLALLLMLKKWRLNPEDVQVIQVGASPVMLISLQKGGIDAAMLQEPFSFVAEDDGFKVLGDPVSMDIHYLQNMLVSTRSYLRAHRDLVSRFIRAYIEGIAYFKKNKDESLKVLMKKMRVERGNENYLQRSYQLSASQYFDSIPYPSMLGVKTVLEFLAKDNPKAKGADPNSFVDASFVKALDDSGFIKALY